MTDGNTTWNPSTGEQPGRPRRWVLVTGGAAAVAVLATVGAVGGWVLAGGSGSGRPEAGGPTVATEASSPTSSPISTEPGTAEPTGGSTRPAVRDDKAVPNLVGMDFEQARSELRKRGLGWQLIFGVGFPARAAGGTTLTGRSVIKTAPGAGAASHSGLTVKLFVIGAAPPVAVPDITGLACGKARDRLVNDGLYPDYPGAKSGPVTRQDPAPETVVRWNDRVQIYCGSAPSTPYGSPTP